MHRCRGLRAGPTCCKSWSIWETGNVKPQDAGSVLLCVAGCPGVTSIRRLRGRSPSSQLKGESSCQMSQIFQQGTRCRHMSLFWSYTGAPVVTFVTPNQNPNDTTMYTTGQCPWDEFPVMPIHWHASHAEYFSRSCPCSSHLRSIRTVALSELVCIMHVSIVTQDYAKNEMGYDLSEVSMQECGASCAGVRLEPD